MDELINAIEGVRHIDTSEVPKHPGIYLCHPHPDDIDGVIRQMWRIWEQENTGVYVDEGYMVCPSGGGNPAFRSILTQGRSKHIPVICLSQRPVWLDRFVFSESDYYQIFALNDSEDRRQVSRFVPYDPDLRLDDFHSWYYDVGRDRLVIVRPVPQKEELLAAFAARMKRTDRRIFV
jgi:hypothetical protein